MFSTIIIQECVKCKHILPNSRLIMHRNGLFRVQTLGKSLQPGGVLTGKPVSWAIPLSVLLGGLFYGRYQ
jgi:hypothetical protein